MKKNIKNKIKREKYSKNLFLKPFIGVIYGLWATYKFITDGYYRSIFLAQLRSENVHQPLNITRMDRYPELFKAAQKYFQGSKKPLRLLSFGCSTGEEAFTLREYFPAAQIIGVDISRWNIKICHQRNRDENIIFRHSDYKTLLELGPFDAIYCLAVLQHPDLKTKMMKITDSTAIYPFHKFDKQIEELDSLLAVNGLLILNHTNYRFFDSSVGHKYKVLAGLFSKTSEVTKFDKHNKKMEHEICEDRIFIKEK